MNIADQLNEQAAINKKIGSTKAPIKVNKQAPVNIVAKKKPRSKKT